MGFFRKEIAFSLLINLLHYYAFAIYAFSAVILAPKFFHAQSEELTSLLAVISISLTVIIRPLGGFILVKLEIFTDERQPFFSPFLW